MTDQALIGGLLDKDDERTELVSAIESYIRSIKVGK